MQTLTPERFRDEVEAFLARTEMFPTELGKQAVGDPNFVFDLREGRKPRRPMIERVSQFMRSFEAGRGEAA